jgi:hypothetical protein
VARAKSAARGFAGCSMQEEIAHLRGLDLKGLQARWRSVMGRPAPLHLPRHLMFGILAWRIQADALGDLDGESMRLLKQTASASAADQITPVLAIGDRRRRTLLPGTILSRDWNGQTHRVMVIAGAYAWDGKTYDSLSQVAFAITGTRWNGPRFFGLRDKIHSDGGAN